MTSDFPELARFTKTILSSGVFVLSIATGSPLPACPFNLPYAYFAHQDLTTTPAAEMLLSWEPMPATAAIFFEHLTTGIH